MSEIVIVGLREDEPVIMCDLCGEERKCVPRQIEDREFDICEVCWRPLAEKLSGKGRRMYEAEELEEYVEAEI